MFTTVQPAFNPAIADFAGITPGPLGPRKIFYVSNTGQHKNTGHHNRTLGQALRRCKPYRGDIIVVRRQHVEQLNPLNTADFNIDVAGVTIIGEGGIGTQPVFKWEDADKSITITAPDVTIQGCTFMSIVSTLLVMFDVASRGFKLIDCLLTSNVNMPVDKFIQSTDMAIIDAASTGTPWTSWTTDDGGLKSWMDGQSIEVISGTNDVPGRYTLGYTSGNAFTTDIAAGDTGAASAVVCAISNCADMVIQGCTFLAIIDGGAAAIELAGMGENVLIKGNYFHGFWDEAVVSAITLKSYDLQIIDNIMIDRKAGGLPIEVIDATGGIMSGNHTFSDTVSDTEDLVSCENYHTISDALSGKIIPAIA